MTAFFKSFLHFLHEHVVGTTRQVIIQWLLTVTGYHKSLAPWLGTIRTVPARKTLLQALAAPKDRSLLPPVRYAYDPIAECPSYLHAPAHGFPINTTRNNKRVTCLNSIQIDPLAAGLPFRSSLNYVRASRYWKANVEETIRILELLAADHSASDVEVDHGLTLAKIARKELQSDIENRIVLATTYMFSGADESRTRLIAVLMVLYFVFDDKVEETPNSTLTLFRNDFFARIQHGFDGPAHKSNPEASPLQQYIDNVIAKIQAHDKQGGNGGKEMITALLSAFRCVHPAHAFRSAAEYLAFRRPNVGADFVIAATKFCSSSSIPSNDPKFARYLRLISDHLGLVNDLASYDKELRICPPGREAAMVNFVAVMKELMSLESERQAKAVAYTYQLEVEREIVREIEMLVEAGLSREEEDFVEGLWLAATGNVMFCVVSRRYGGEAARVR